MLFLGSYTHLMSDFYIYTLVALHILRHGCRWRHRLRKKAPSRRGAGGRRRRRRRTTTTTTTGARKVSRSDTRCIIL